MYDYSKYTYFRAELIISKTNMTTTEFLFRTYTFIRFSLNLIAKGSIYRATHLYKWYQLAIGLPDSARSYINLKLKYFLVKEPIWKLQYQLCINLGTHKLALTWNQFDIRMKTINQTPYLHLYLGDL